MIQLTNTTLTKLSDTIINTSVSNWLSESDEEGVHATLNIIYYTNVNTKQTTVDQQCQQ